MGHSRAGDHGRLILLRGHRPAEPSRNVRQPVGPLASWDDRLRAAKFTAIVERPHRCSRHAASVKLDKDKPGFKYIPLERHVREHSSDFASCAKRGELVREVRVLRPDRCNWRDGERHAAPSDGMANDHWWFGRDREDAAR